MDDDDRGAEGEEVEAEETGEEEEWELARYSGGRWRAFLAKFKLRSLRREWMLLMVARRAKVVYLSIYVPGEDEVFHVDGQCCHRTEENDSALIPGTVPSFAKRKTAQ